MSEYYSPKRTKNLFTPTSKEPFKLSRSKIDLFLECPRCFYLDRKKGVGRPPGFPFSLNAAVDFLLKKEFDVHRGHKSKHPLMEEYGVDAIPFAHKNMDIWRENFVGVQHHHTSTNFIVFGAVDDVWINPTDELIVVDYKATSKDGEVTLDADWQDGYKRQMEVYQWLLRRNDFKVSSTGYFVYANGRRDKEAFDKQLEFQVKIIPYTGDDSWIEQTLIDAKECLMKDELPEKNILCDYCNYRDAAGKEIREIYAHNKKRVTEDQKIEVNTGKKSTLF